MQMQDKIVINDYIENDPLSEENLDKTLENVNEIRLLCPNKSIWLYTGYEIRGIDDGLFIFKPNVITDKIVEPNKIQKMYK